MTLAPGTRLGPYEILSAVGCFPVEVSALLREIQPGALRSIAIEVVQRDRHRFGGGCLSTVIRRESYRWLALAQELRAG